MIPKVVIGKIPVKMRNSSEFILVDIVKSKFQDRVMLSLENNSKPLISRTFKDEYYDTTKNPNKNFGLHLRHIIKTADGESYQGLGKIMDILAVDESLKRGFGGKIYLHAVGNSNPLHWARGFRNINDIKKSNNALITKIKTHFANKHNQKMNKLFKKFIDGIKSGINPRDAQNSISKHILKPETMGLPEDIIQKHIETAKKIKYL